MYIFHSVAEVGQPLELFCAPVSLLFGTSFRIYGYHFPAGMLEGLGTALGFMGALFTLAAVERGCALAYPGIIATALGFKASGTLFHFCLVLAELEISRDVLCLTVSKVCRHQLYILSGGKPFIGRAGICPVCYYHGRFRVYAFLFKVILKELAVTMGVLPILVVRNDAAIFPCRFPHVCRISSVLLHGFLLVGGIQVGRVLEYGGVHPAVFLYAQAQRCSRPLWPVPAVRATAADSGQIHHTCFHTVPSGWLRLSEWLRFCQRSPRYGYGR